MNGSLGRVFPAGLFHFLMYFMVVLYGGSVACQINVLLREGFNRGKQVPVLMEVKESLLDGPLER